MAPSDAHDSLAEVSHRALGPLTEALREAGFSPEEILGSTGAQAERLRWRGRLPWRDFTAMLERTATLLGGPEALEEAVYRHLDAPSFAFMHRVAGAIVRPRDLFWMGTTWFGRMLFPIIDADFEELPDGRLRERLAIPEPHEPSPEFFHAMRGALRAGPQLLRLDDARVEMHIWGRTATYWITLPPDPGLGRRRLRNLFRGSRAPALIEELSAQQDELRTSLDALRRVNEDLEKRVEERTHELLASQTRLRDSHHLVSLGTLSAGVAHEINNPLAAIQATAQLLLTQADEGRSGGADESRAAVERIIAESRRCSRIVRGLLQFARNEPTEKWPVEINDVAIRSLALARREADGRRVALHFEACDRPVWTLGNTLQLEQVLVNLLRNAIQASEAGRSVSLRTGVVDAEGHWSRIVVADRGCGIAERDLPRVFEPFFTTRQHAGGSGLGLSMAHGIVEEHGGRLSLSSEPRRGCEAIVDLPLCEPPAPGSAAQD